MEFGSVGDPAPIFFSRPQKKVLVKAFAERSLSLLRPSTSMWSLSNSKIEGLNLICVRGRFSNVVRFRYRRCSILRFIAAELDLFDLQCFIHFASIYL